MHTRYDINENIPCQFTFNDFFSFHFNISYHYINFLQKFLWISKRKTLLILNIGAEICTDFIYKHDFLLLAQREHNLSVSQ